MISIRRVSILTFILITIVSVSLISYSVYLLFGAYDVGRLLDVSISNINVTRAGDETSLVIYFLFNNTSKFTLRLVYAAAFVYLNGQALTPSNAPATLIIYSNPIPLPSLSENVQVPIRVSNVPSYKVPMNSSRYWAIRLEFNVYDVPLTGSGTYGFDLQFRQAGS
jgi:hypothetical protein